MKKLTSILVSLFLLLFIVNPVSAQMMGDMMETDTHDDHETLEEVLPLLLGKYDVQEIDELECNRLTDEDYERLGDAVMEENHPGSQHEMMDRMMGGDGSENLRQMHRNMGRGYLNCLEGKEVSTMMYGNGWSGMPMQGSMFGGFSWLFAVNSLLLAVLLIVLIRYFWNKGGKK